jgi:hypothetical protein
MPAPAAPAPSEPAAARSPEVPVPVPSPEPFPAERETFPHMGKSHEIRVAKDIWFRFGFQTQIWYDSQQSPTVTAVGDGKYAQNFFLRRARLIVSSQIRKDVSAFLQLDAPRLGQALAGANADSPATKRFNAQDGGGSVLLDGWTEIKLVGEALMLEAGLMLIPFSRNELQSSTTFLTLDIAPTSQQIPNTFGQRDVGFEVKGYLLRDHLEYRAGIFSGSRQAANAMEGNPIGHNLFRATGMLQYNLFDVEKGYIFAGHNYGRKKIVALTAGFDGQNSDSPQTTAYWAASASIAGSWPLSGQANPNGGDELSWLLQYYHYEGGPRGTSADAASIPGAPPKQNDFLGELAYYNRKLSSSVFGKYEIQHFLGRVANANNTFWLGGGVKYYIWDNFCNFTLAFNRQQFPDAPTSGTGAKNAANELTFQTQVYYY